MYWENNCTLTPINPLSDEKHRRLKTLAKSRGTPLNR
jgi:hypothetical protein